MFEATPRNREGAHFARGELCAVAHSMELLDVGFWPGTMQEPSLSRRQTTDPPNLGLQGSTRGDRILSRKSPKGPQ